MASHAVDDRHSAGLWISNFGVRRVRRLLTRTSLVSRNPLYVQICLSRVTHEPVLLIKNFWVDSELIFRIGLGPLPLRLGRRSPGKRPMAISELRFCRILVG